jgi:hypothetical protein
VKIDAALTREVICQFPVEPGLAQARMAPGDNVGSSPAGAGLLVGSQVHVSLADPDEPFLLI